MSEARRLAIGLMVLGTILLIGVGGYMVIESASVLDAVYMTVITITTVGFEEVIELSAGGKVLTIVIILFGVGAALYTAGIALEVGLERLMGGERRRRRMVRDIERISDHVVLCGWGRVGETPIEP